MPYTRVSLAPDERPGQNLLNNQELRLMAGILVEEQGVRLAEILAGTGLAGRLLSQPAQWLTPEQELILYTRIAHCNVDPALGIRVGQHLNLPTYGVLGCALMASSNLAEALELLTEFAPLVSWASHSQLSAETYKDKACACLSIIPTAEDARTRQLEIDSTFASLKVLFDELLGQNVPFAVLDVERHCSQADLSAHHILMTCPIRTGRQRNALLIDQDWLARPLPHPQPEHRTLFRDLCHQSTAALTEQRGLVAVVRRSLQVEEGAAPKLERVAEELNLSSRTLRRQLRTAGVTFQSLLDESRYRKARIYLESTGLTVEAIARRLGYADARSFRTAFKRWSGETPAEYRKVTRA